MPAVLTPRSESRARQYAPSTADEAKRQSNTEEEEAAADSATFHPRGDATTNNKITPESSASVMSTTVSVTMDKASIKAVPDERSTFERFADNVNHALTGGFFRLGYSVAKNPYKYALGSFLICLMLTVGIFAPGLTNENRSDKLWVPSDTQAQDDNKYVSQFYGAEARFGEVIVKKAGGGDVLDPAVFAAVKTLVDRIEATSMQWDGATIGWQDQCLKIGAACAISHPIQAFATAADYDTRDEIVQTVNGGAGSYKNLATGQPLNLDGTIGGQVLDANGKVTSASAVRVGFLTKIHETIVDGDEVDERGDAFERKLLDVFEAGIPGVELTFIVSRSFGDEFGAAIQSDLGLLQAAFMLILAYAALMLSRWDEGCVGSRVAVTFSGVVSVGMAIAASYGFCSYIGLFFSPLMNVLPFLLLGIGVDDMFVIVNQYDHMDPTLDPATRIGKALASAGASILVTSATDVFAFLVGSNTTLPALRNFCFYASFGILFIFAFMVTWFVAFLVLDERRRSRSQGDVICCFVTKNQACCACCAPREDKRTRMERAFGESLGGQLVKPWVKGAVCVGFAAIAVGGFIGCSQLEIDADVNDFIPAGSYVKDWFADTNAYFAKLGDSIAVYSRDVDVHSADGAALMLAASTAFKADPYVAETSVSSWIESFNAHRGATGAFALADLHAWTTTVGSSGMPFKGDIVWRNETNNVPNEGIISTRMRGNHVKSYKSDDKVKSMDSLRESLEAVPGNGAGNVFAFSDSWLSYEQYKSIASEATRNIASTMAGMVVIIAILLISPKAVLIVCLCLCLIIINIMGYMHFWGQTLDSVTIIMLIIALGLSVDYSAHIGRAFMEHRGTPDERLKNSLADMGVAVFNGAISTFLAVIVLSSSESYVFVTFFRQLFLCIVFGLGHGLVLLPVLMSLFPPKPFDAPAHLQ